MFYYYGGKAQHAHRYPRPVFRTIVEPFAGSAGYAMRHLGHVDRVVLVEKDERVVALWRRLLAMSPAEVLALPVPVPGSDTSDFLHMTAATSNATGGALRLTVTERAARDMAKMQRRIARLLAAPGIREKIELHHGDYTLAPDLEATWFIDPPYQVTSVIRNAQGSGYGPGCRSADLDYGRLGEWCRARRGQVIVCEQPGATWLDFTRVLTFQSTGNTRMEAAWLGGRRGPIPMRRR